MAIENPVATLPGAVASTDLSAHQFKFVDIDASGEIAVAGAGVDSVGVLQNKPSAQGRAATVWGPGSVCKVIAGAAVAAGARVTPDATGRAVTAVTGNRINGRALMAAGAAGEIISVFISGQGAVA